MPLQPAEVLQALQEATAEAKATIQDLHLARRDALAVIKENKAKITDAIVAEVHAQVDAIGTEAENEMLARITRVIAGLEGAWRDKLGLP